MILEVFSNLTDSMSFSFWAHTVQVSQDGSAVRGRCSSPVWPHECWSHGGKVLESISRSGPAGKSHGFPSLVEHRVAQSLLPEGFQRIPANPRLLQGQ